MSFSSEDIIDGPYTLNGTTVDFSFTFEIWATSDLLVTITQTDGTEVPLTLTTHYSVSATNNDFSTGGTVTITNAVRDAYTTGTITITQDLDFIQESEYTSGVTLDRALLEQDLDRAARRDLILKNRQDRNLQVPFTDLQAGSMEIPNKATRASHLLGFDADGLPIATDGTGSVAISTWAATLVDDTSAGAALTTLGLTAFIQTLVDDTTAAIARATLEAAEDNIEQGYMNLSMTNITSTSEPTFTGDVEVNGTLVTLATASGTGWSGLSTSSDAWVYVTSAGAVSYSATVPAWSSSLGGWYNSNDRSVAWLRKDSSDTYSYKHFLPTEQQGTILLEEVVDIGDWDMSIATGSQSTSVNHELDLGDIREVHGMIRSDQGTTQYSTDSATQFTAPEPAVFFTTLTTSILIGRDDGIGPATGADYNATTYNRGWVIIRHVAL